MKNVYKVISSYSTEDTNKGLSRLDTRENEIADKIIDDLNNNFFMFNGEICHWEEGNRMYAVLIMTEDEIKQFKEIDDKLHDGFEGYTTIEDITESVLYDMFDCNVFGFAKSDMEYTFFQYRKKYITKDDILDKIIKHGKESLTQNDLLFLEDKKMIYQINQQKLLSL
jgi:hypothetical protein